MLQIKEEMHLCRYNHWDALRWLMISDIFGWFSYFKCVSTFPRSLLFVLSWAECGNSCVYLFSLQPHLKSLNEYIKDVLLSCEEIPPDDTQHGVVVFGKFVSPVFFSVFYNNGWTKDKCCNDSESHQLLFIGIEKEWKTTGICFWGINVIPLSIPPLVLINVWGRLADKNQTEINAWRQTGWWAALRNHPDLEENKKG